MRLIATIFLILVLTLLTQIGGALLLLCICAGRLLRWRHLATAGVFAVAYAGSTLLIVPPLAALGGRVPLPCENEPLRANALYCVLNRNYVTPRMRDLAEALAADLAKQRPGTITVALDANFPFLDGFPLVPHFSHDDGRKLDFAYFYAASDGQYQPGATRSPLGYWAFEQPGAGEATKCPAEWLTARWDMTFLQPLLPDLPLESDRTRAALSWLVTKGRQFGVERVFVEPYLAARLGVTSSTLGFQGCRAARQDDHMHVQIAE